MATIRTIKRKTKGTAYQVLYDVYEKDFVTGESKRRWQTELFTDKLAARKFKAEVEKKKMDDAQLSPSSETVTKFLYRWIDVYAKDKNWSPSTYTGNLALMENHIIPVLGGRRMQKLTTEMIDRFFSELKLKKVTPKGKNKKAADDAPCLSSKTRREIYNLLKSAFNTAKKWGVIDKELVTCQRPPKGKVDIKPWDNSTIYSILERIQDPVLHLAVHMAFACTLRNGETVGMTWDNIDFEKSELRVKQTLQRADKMAMNVLMPDDIYFEFPEQRKNAKSVLVLKSPKTDESARTINMPEPLKEELLARKEKIQRDKDYYGAEYSDYNLVLCYDNGNPIEPGKMEERFRIWQKGADLEFCYNTFHGLRHSSVTSKLKASKGDIKSVQAHSGHASAEMILDVYGHIQEADKKEMSSAFEAEFYGRGNQREGDFDAMIDAIKNDPKLYERALGALLAQDAPI